VLPKSLQHEKERERHNSLSPSPAPRRCGCLFPSADGVNRTQEVEECSVLLWPAVQGAAHFATRRRGGVEGRAAVRCGGVGTQRDKNKKKQKQKQNIRKVNAIFAVARALPVRGDRAVLARASRPGLGVGRRLSRSKPPGNDPRAVLLGRVGRGRPLPQAH